MISTLLIFFFAALVVSFLCSLLEATLLSVTHAHIEVLIRRKRPAGHALKQLKDRIDRPLIAILTLNTVANMFGAAGVGAEASKIAAARTISEPIAVGVASGVLTLCILVFSEIVPKTIGAAYWKTFAPLAAGPLRVVVIVLAPLIAMLEFIPRLISRNSSAGSVTREEIGILAEVGRAHGSIHAEETRVISNLLSLREMQTQDVVTPRIEVASLRDDLTIAEALRDRDNLRHSRIPVHTGTLDNTTGFVLRDRVMELALAGRHEIKLRQIARPIHIVPETKTLASLLEEFLRRHEHLFLVVNEYGGAEGVVTLEDVVEALLGAPIVDETDATLDLRAAAMRRVREHRERIRALEAESHGIPDPD
ncbi:MAG: DUF21 domain-containing protein [Phycisphaeraceae bacterium]|nr:DUF21 domain-containing protein [Phycisphaeraceae bacterium]